jgi:microcystin-dependent protein
MSKETSQERFNKKAYGSLKLYNDTISSWVPIRGTEIGDVKYSLRSNDHLGWLICDGRSLSRTTYSDLYSIIGTTYGSNSGTTFNLPDCRGRVLGGSGSGSGLTARSTGTLLGTETHTMTVNQMPTHSHGITDPTHAHDVNNTVVTNGLNTLTTSDTGGGPSEINLAATQTTTSTSSATGITINTAGNSQAFNIMQPTAFIGYVFIFAIYTNEVY